MEYPREKDRTGWINLYYPTLEAGIYCSYLSVTPATIRAVEEESYALLYRQTPSPQRITEQTYENRQTNVYAGLYVSPASPASPLQFVLTDGQKHFFRGTLVYNRPAPADSLAPVTDYLKADLQELIQSFQWEKSHAALPPA
ncbi:MAG: gliding motility protein GldD [Tannerellaceae bacterium]|nr:gliding motility protein GldD [Tannerellaceae bacterium]